LGPRCWDTIRSQLPVVVVAEQQEATTHVQRVLELREGVDSFLVGTLVKEAVLLSSKDETPLHPDVPFCKASDALFLEDASGRVSLLLPGAMLHQFCTGVVAGVQGTLGADGVLVVTQVYSPAPVAVAPRNLSTNNSRAPQVLFLSGLHCGGAAASSLPRDMLLSFLQGRLGEIEKASCISHIVVAGGLIAPKTATTTTSTTTTTAACLRDLDAFLVQLTAASGIPVDVLPGQDDPTTANWPQRPLHSALLPRSTTAAVLRTPNPYAAVHADATLVVGTDGRSIRDLTQRLLVESTPTMPTNNKEHDATLTPISELDALARTLEWSHLCPTGPDSVPTVPERDPMVLTARPTIYFMGNATQFATTMKDETRLVCLPSFGVTGQAVLVNLETLGVEVLRFEE
jgi:DNA polymerase delta subunit 2